MQTKLKIVVSGPESVGKSTLTRQLAEYFNASYVDEIARDFIAKLDREYTKQDVLAIAKLQIKAEQYFKESDSRLLILDTDLIITKVWLRRVFNDIPDWIDKHLESEKADLHLLCYPDLPWEPDPLRENPNIREDLFDEYMDEISNLDIPYFVIKGQNGERLKAAIKLVDEFIKNKL